MQFAGISYVAVIVAAAAGYAFGAAYYAVLGAKWMAALGKSEEQIRAGVGNRAVPFIIAAVAQLVMAYMLAGIIGHLGFDQVTPGNGLLSGAFLWLGFVVTVLAVNYAFQGAHRALTVIDGGHWLGVLLVQGAVIGAIGL